MSAPLISVIVPVYKVEKYLEKCIESIVNQSYSNLEIILVDDGSPDLCGKICDIYAEKDSRIKVIHKKNGGVSTARNAALDIMQGDYVGFVDSDDYIDLKMYEYLINYIIEYEADISICEFRKIYESNGEIQADNPRIIQCLNNLQAMELLIGDEIIGSQPCNKLFRAELFKNIRFPQGRVYEDIAIMHRVFSKANRVVCSSQMMYNYLIRGNSTSYSQSPQWGYSLYKAFADRYNYIKNYFPSLEKVAESKLIGIAVGMYIHLQKFPSNKEMRNWEKEISNQLKKHRKTIWNMKEIRLIRRIDAYVLSIFPSVIKIKYKIFYRISGAKNEYIKNR